MPYTRTTSLESVDAGRTAHCLPNRQRCWLGCPLTIYLSDPRPRHYDNAIRELECKRHRGRVMYLALAMQEPWEALLLFAWRKARAEFLKQVCAVHKHRGNAPETAPLCLKLEILGF